MKDNWRFYWQSMKYNWRFHFQFYEGYLAASLAVSHWWHGCFTASYRLVGLVVKASTLTPADLDSIPASSVGLFQGRVIPVT